MQPYTILAKYYDKFTDKDCDYVRWSQYLYRIARAHGVKNVADLACGTGKMTELLARYGFALTGVDVSADMLNEARSKTCRAAFVQQDMRKLRLLSPTDMAVCVNDGVNYLKQSEVTPFFRQVAANLKEGAPFVFDVSSPDKLRNQLGDNVFYWDDDGETLLWSNRFCGDCVKMELTLFVADGDGRYSRFDERHVQYVHTREQLTDALAEAGFEVREVSDCYGSEKNLNFRLTFYAVKRYI